jgi:hypothetical protein
MNNPDHISESLETIVWVKILKFFDADPGSGMEKTPQIRNTGNLLIFFLFVLNPVPDPQQCF